MSGIIYLSRSVYFYNDKIQIDIWTGTVYLNDVADDRIVERYRLK
jgi:hypothetical protein